MLVWVAVAFVGLVVGVAVAAATRPSDFRVVRSRAMAAPPAAIHPHVADFQKWPAWSPWEKLDPGMFREVSTPSAGPGATYYWRGNNKVGEGRMTITGSEPPRSVDLRLEFMRPWKATNATRFDLVPNAAGTDVTWSMTGTHNLVAKAFGLFVDMDELVGKDFERGLANLEAAATGAPGART